MDATSTDMELREYKEFLEKLAAEDSTTVITNGGKDHAIILYSVLLSKSNNVVRIFCQSGDSEIWKDDRFKDSLTHFLNKDKTQLQVLTVNPPALSNEWTKMDNVKAHQIERQDKKSIYDHFRNEKCNFAVFDDKRYRYEYDCENFKAYGCFNSPTNARKMTTLFDNAFANVNSIKSEQDGGPAVTN